MKKKWELPLTTLLCLLPAAAGLFVYDALPERIATHFGLSGEPDGWSGRAFAVFGIPAIMAGINLAVQLALAADPKKQNVSPRLRAISVWIVPVVSVFAGGVMLGHAMGYSTRVETVAPLLAGLLLVAVGSCLPGTGQSDTVGIRLPWTLASQENWQRTHRLAGFLWVTGGGALVLIALLRFRTLWLLIGVLAALVIVPCAYSYLLFRKGI